MNDTLVAYFSATGTTGKAAEALANRLNADLFEIRPEHPYSNADLNWNDKSSRSSKEMNDEACRPRISESLDSIDAYSTIYIGFPVWWYVEPRIIDTFLEAHDFSGKTIVPFATSGGSGLGKTAERMQHLCPGAHVLRGGLFNDHSAGSLDTFIAANS